MKYARFSSFSFQRHPPKKHGYIFLSCSTKQNQRNKVVPTRSSAFFALRLNLDHFHFKFREVMFKVSWICFGLFWSKLHDRIFFSFIARTMKIRIILIIWWKSRYLVFWNRDTLLELLLWWMDFFLIILVLSQFHLMPNDLNWA